MYFPLQVVHQVGLAGVVGSNVCVQMAHRVTPSRVAAPTAARMTGGESAVCSVSYTSMTSLVYLTQNKEIIILSVYV